MQVANAPRSRRITAEARRNLAVIGPKQIAAAIALWKRAVPKSLRDKIAARARARRQQKQRKHQQSMFGILAEAGADMDFVAEFADELTADFGKRLDPSAWTEHTITRGPRKGRTVWKSPAGSTRDTPPTSDDDAPATGDHGHDDSAEKGGSATSGDGDTRRAPDHKSTGGVSTPAQQAELAVAGQKGDKEAIAQLVDAPEIKGMIVNLAWKMSGKVPFEDLVQEGTRGLLEAISRFKADKNTGGFMAYAGHWIRKYMRSATAKAGRKASKEGGEGSSHESASNTPDTRHEDPVETVAKASSAKNLRAAISNLDEQSQKVLTLRYGLDGKEPRKLAEIGKILGISHARVSQIEQAALKELRKHSANFSEEDMFLLRLAAETIEADGDVEFAEMLLFSGGNPYHDERGRFAHAADSQHLHAPVVGMNPLEGGANKGYRVDLANGKRAIFKPSDGEEWDLHPNVPRGSYYRRETAASDVARVLGMDDVVPRTVTREIGGKTGSVQEMVANAVPARILPISQRMGNDDKALNQAVAFDYLMGQADRHPGNWMLQQGKLKLIDNGLSLPLLESPGDLVNQIPLQHVVQRNMLVPDLEHWQGKWGALEEAMKGNGIGSVAIGHAKKRYETLMASQGKPWAELPYAGKSIGGIVDRIQKSVPKMG